MRILLTGVTGQVGGALLPRLSALGTVVAADRNMLDLATPQEIAGRLDELEPDLIVNPAAYTAVDGAEDERDLAFAVNAEAPRALAEWAAIKAVPMVHFSTDYVFNGQGALPWREDDAGAPLSVYGLSKLGGDSGPQLRLPAPCHQDLVGLRRHGQQLPAHNHAAGEGAQELRVVADQFGAPTSAELIADCVMRVLGGSPDTAAAFDKSGGIIHLTASGCTSWHGFASAIVSGLRRRGVPLAVDRLMPIDTAEYPTKAKRPLNSRLDLSRLSTVFGVTPDEWTESLDRELDRVVAAD